MLHYSLDIAYRCHFCLFQVQCMYVWIDGSGEGLRGKTKTVETEPMKPDGKKQSNLKYYKGPSSFVSWVFDSLTLLMK